MAKQFILTVGSVSWIHQRITPVKYLTDAEFYQPAWLPKTYLGLFATKNKPPPGQLDLPGYRASKQFRAMTFANLLIDTSDDGQEVTSVTVRDGILDPGWTPPFDRTISLLTRWYVPEPSMEDPNFHAGNLGKGSAIIPRGRHRNTTIALAVPERNLVASGLIFFRAGNATDNIGTNIVKCPYHVPWVWCEWLVTHDAGRFTVLATGSVFPTHSFYVQGVNFGRQDEPTDAQFLRNGAFSRQIDTGSLRVYPVLTVGAPASSPQVEDSTHVNRGPATSISYAVRGSSEISSISL